MTDRDLTRFAKAQEAVLDDVVAELHAGCKRSHWMWFVFPQVDGLGHSAMARRYAIRDLEEARLYLADPVLGDRLRRCVRLMLAHEGKSALDILGSPDDMKFRSCLTLFHQAAESEEDRILFEKALAAFYGGAPDPRTSALLERRP